MVTVLHSSAELHYNFTYRFRGAAHGVVLLIFPFRVFYESSASVNFKARPTEEGNYEFFFNDIAATGYMMRTTGLSGRTLVILTADYDLKRGHAFGIEKLAGFSKMTPYYSGFVRRKKTFLFKIFSRDKDSIKFVRHPSGLFSAPSIDFDVRFQYFPEVLNIDFNIFKILVEMIKANSHPVLVDTDIAALRSNPSQRWYSPPLDFSDNLNRIGPLAARFVGQVAHFKQEEPFQLEYRLEEATDRDIIIYGLARPEVSIWGKFVISSFSRRLKLRTEDNVLLEDVLRMDIRKIIRKGEYRPHNGLVVEATLKLID